MRQTFSEGGGASKGQPCPDKTMPIAVIGIGCRCAGDATDPENLFDMVKKAREAWRLIPKDRYNNEAFYHPDRSRNGTVSLQRHLLIALLKYCNSPILKADIF